MPTYSYRGSGGYVSHGAPIQGGGTRSIRGSITSPQSGGGVSIVSSGHSPSPEVRKPAVGKPGSLPKAKNVAKQNLTKTFTPIVAPIDFKAPDMPKQQEATSPMWDVNDLNNLYVQNLSKLTEFFSGTVSDIAKTVTQQLGETASGGAETIGGAFSAGGQQLGETASGLQDWLGKGFQDKILLLIGILGIASIVSKRL